MRLITRGARRPRWLWATLIGLTVALGIGSRRGADALPGFLALYAGDTLWALAAFLGFGLSLPRATTATISLLAASFSVAVELSQLYHAPWIDAIRSSTVGGLILGFGFLWSDLACYAMGVGLGVLLEWGARRAAVPGFRGRDEPDPTHSADPGVGRPGPRT